jgi:hypothetical protein
MRRYDLGDPIALRQIVTDDDENPIAATGTLTLTKPDGTTYDGVVQPGGTGILDVTVPPAEAGALGRYGYVWSILTPFEDTVPGAFDVGPVDDEVPPLASFASLARKLGAAPEDFDDEERDRGEYLLDEASELIRDEADKTWLVAGTNALDAVPRRVARICVAVAARAFENPEGLSQRVLGDSTKGYDRTGREGGEAVYLTAEELAAVKKAAGASTFTAVTLTSPYSADLYEDEVLWA